MGVPEKTTVLVIGGGPAGSYAASALAREGIDTVLLEAEKMPRYHVGESMLPSLRHYLRFIDAADKLDAHGFIRKNGALFKLNSKPAAYTDFVGAGGPNGYSFNIIRSQSDELLFRHAGASGAHIFDGHKVNSIKFEPSGQPPSSDPDFTLPDPGRPVSVSWTCKETGESGETKFDYLVDASGRQGMVSTKYWKNRTMNSGEQLQSVATWGYWTGAGVVEKGTIREGCPYFEAIADASGWTWFIPLHNGQWSVGVVMNQKVLTEKKRAATAKGGSAKDVYLDTIRATPGLQGLLEKAELATELRSASDWSYIASAYSGPYLRVAGDAGCFIDPFFSSGVHLALTGGFSAAATICASIKGQTSEMDAAMWHTKKISESYTRFLVIVSAALKQINSKDEPLISDFHEKTFERAFKHFRPIIQGTADVQGKLSQTEISNALNFCFGAFQHVDVEEKKALMAKMRQLAIANPEDMSNKEYATAVKELEEVLTPEQMRILQTIRARQMLRPEDMFTTETIGSDVIDGLSVNMVTGKFGLVKPEDAYKEASGGKDIMALLNGEELSSSSIGFKTDPGYKAPTLVQSS